MNIELDLLPLALSNLPKHIEAQVSNENVLKGAYRDAIVSLTVGDQLVRFDVEIKKVHRKESLSKLITHKLVSGQNNHTLLICNPLSDFLADYCEEHQINFIDTAGNARIQTPDFTLWISGKKASSQDSVSTQKPLSRMSVGTMKLLFVLLTQPEALNSSYRELSALAGISLGMVSKSFKYLTDEGFVRSANKQRRFMNEDLLTIQWVREYNSVLRPKLGGLQLTAPKDWKDITLLEGEIWGGEAAAEQLTQYLKPEMLQLFTSESLQRRIGQLKLRPDSNGKLWLVPVFWGANLPINTTAKALLSVAELVASGDSRNRETAEIINERYLHLKELPSSRL